MYEFAMSQVDALQPLMGSPGPRHSRVDCPGQKLSGELEGVIEYMQVLHAELELGCFSTQDSTQVSQC